MGIEEVKGGSPYGASTIAGAQGERQPSTQELDYGSFPGQAGREPRGAARQCGSLRPGPIPKPRFGSGCLR
jgi:NAD(P)H dehydrogenase (quinone)